MITKAKITLVKSLSDKAERVSTGLFVAEGEKLVSDLIKSGLRVEEVFAVEGAADSLPFFDNITEITAKDISRLTHLKTPPSVLALVRIPAYGISLTQLKGSLSLALDDVQDPGNLGTIIRLADWFGIDDIICSPATADCFNPKVVQATMGAIARVRVHYTPLPDILSQASQAGIPLMGASLEGEDIYTSELPLNGIMVMGNEGRGISAAVGKLVDRRISIPSFRATGGSESLNVAAATAIVCSELRRRGR